MNRQRDLTPAPPERISWWVEMEPPDGAAPYAGSVCRKEELGQLGLLTVNADDWGRDVLTTTSIRDCVARGTVSSVSAMVFMEDSERAAVVARERGIDAGLHLNFTMPFSAPNCPTQLLERHFEISTYLRRHRLARVIFHPGLARSFDYVVKAQLDEYCRLFGAEPERLDGHHHMHLCANVLLGQLLPHGTLVRRNFSFQPGERSTFNRLYRRGVDHILARRHRLLDFFFSLRPLDPPERVQQIFSLARSFSVEVETHPIQPEEYRFLMGKEILRLTASVRIGLPSTIPRQKNVDSPVKR